MVRQHRGTRGGSRKQWQRFASDTAPSLIGQAGLGRSATAGGPLGPSSRDAARLGNGLRPQGNDGTQHADLTELLRFLKLPEEGQKVEAAQLREHYEALGKEALSILWQRNGGPRGPWSEDGTAAGSPNASRASLAASWGHGYLPAVGTAVHEEGLEHHWHQAMHSMEGWSVECGGEFAHATNERSDGGGSLPMGDRSFYHAFGMPLNADAGSTYEDSYVHAGYGGLGYEANHHMHSGAATVGAYAGGYGTGSAGAWQTAFGEDGCPWPGADLPGSLPRGDDGTSASPRAWSPATHAVDPHWDSNAASSMPQYTHFPQAAWPLVPSGPEGCSRRGLQRKPIGAARAASTPAPSKC